MKNKIIVAGGGASGLMAALTAKRFGAEDVLILERGGEIGKKILVTGSGRCNLTNEYQSPDCYHSSLRESYLPVLSQFSKEDTVRFFEDNGLYLKAKNGYYYPRNAQALSVRDFLRDCCRKAGVRMELKKKITEVSPEYGEHGDSMPENLRRQREKGKSNTNAGRTRFHVLCEDGSVYGCDRLILAGGGRAAPHTGSDGGMLAIAADLGHTLISPVPALTPLCVKKEERKFFQTAAGVRADGRITLVREKRFDGKKNHLTGPAGENADSDFTGTSGFCSDCGEIQFVDYGLSGIPAFNVSGAAGRALADKDRIFAEVDFLPEISSEILKNQFSGYRERFPEDTFRMWLRGYLPTKLSEAILSHSRIPPALYLRKCSEAEADRLLGDLKSMRFELEGTGTFEKAQTTSGGISMREVELKTLESKILPGLYFAGEILDVDGICGGYNLQWAWSSGYAAGKAAAGQGTPREQEERTN